MSSKNQNYFSFVAFYWVKKLPNPRRGLDKSSNRPSLGFFPLRLVVVWVK
jgi:hypothetical protein